jgi:hypothetical protein
MLIPLLFAAGTLSTPELTSQLRIAHTNFEQQATDKFAAVTPTRLEVGQPFVVQFPFLDGDRRGADSGGSSIWTYKDGKLTLLVGGNEVGLFQSPRRSAGNAIFFKAERASAGSYIGESAMGVRRRVSSFIIREYGIVLRARPRGEFSPFMSAESLDFMRRHSKPEEVEAQRDSFVYQANVAGPEARHLVANAVAEVEGIIQPTISGKLTDCETSFAGADVSDPIEIATQRCWTGADVNRVTIKDGPAGRVLAEWVRR